jgi:hypothetical protein
MPNQWCLGNEGKNRTDEMAFNPIGNDKMHAFSLNEFLQRSNARRQPPKEKRNSEQMKTIPISTQIQNSPMIRNYFYLNPYLPQFLDKFTLGGTTDNGMVLFLI